MMASVTVATSSLMASSARLVADESAQDIAEYGIALAMTTVAVGGIAFAIGGDVKALWQNAQSAIHSAV